MMPDMDMTGNPIGMGMGMNMGMGMGMGMGMNYGMNYGPQNFVFVEDPLTELSQSTSAIIRQNPEFLEAMTGLKSENRYDVFLMNAMGIKFAFRCTERSDCCARNCLPAEDRPLILTIRHIVSFDQLDNDYAKVFIRIDKPCHCCCCCCCRPYMDVRLAENNAYLGRLRNPFTCCDDDLEIYDSSGNLRYEIIGDCCQVGFCGGKTVEKLATIRFEIKQNGNFVANIKKLSAGFGEFFTKADSYQVFFPEHASPEEKMMLIIAGLMIDYQFFEKDDDKSSHHRGHHGPHGRHH